MPEVDAVDRPVDFPLGVPRIYALDDHEG
jgi:hypothetical protein